MSRSYARALKKIPEKLDIVVDHEDEIGERAAIQQERLTDEETPPLPPEIARLIPALGFVRDYVTWAHRLTDAPTEYHLLGALVALSIGIGHQVFMQTGPLRLFMNIWAVLIGDSSYFRKTTALNFVRSIIGGAVPERILSEDLTPQSLAKKFSEEPHRIIMPSEFADLLQSMEIDFNKGLKQKFTSLFDVPEDFSKERSSAENSHHVSYPYLVILTATAAEWLKLSERDLRGGFYASLNFHGTVPWKFRLDLFSSMRRPNAGDSSRGNRHLTRNFKQSSSRT